MAQLPTIGFHLNSFTRQVFGQAYVLASCPSCEELVTALGQAHEAGELGDSRVLLLTADPPEHTRLRKMLSPEFTVRRMRRLEPRIAEIVSDALDDLEPATSGIPDSVGGVKARELVKVRATRSV